MLKILITMSIAMIFALGLVVVNPAWGQQHQCGNSIEVRNTLNKKYGETQVSFGVTADGGLAEVLASKDGLTWTIIVSYPNGITCMIANGEGWRTVDQVGTGPEA